MGHLVGHVLAEPQPTRIDTDLEQELGYARHKVAERLVRDDPLIDGLADGDSGQVRLPRRLRITRQNANLDVPDLREFFVAFVEWVDKVLDFSHSELAYTQQSRSGRDFVAEGPADLGRGKWDTVVVEL